jgi:GNAT superfamily N-acetyltransferase
MDKIKVIITDFKTVGLIWREFLWPGRVSPITPTSAIQFGGGYNLSLLGQEAIFLRLVDSSEQTLGVISGFPTQEGYFRSRGLFVFQSFRGRGFSQILLGSIREYARENGHTRLWSLPRQSSWLAYKRFGFCQNSDWFNEGVEFGPNAFASLII